MRNCPNAKRVLVDATFAITNFIKDDNNRLMAIEKGAIEMIRSALDTFDGDAELMEVAYPCLTLLGEDVEEEKRAHGESVPRIVRPHLHTFHS